MVEKKVPKKKKINKKSTKQTKVVKKTKTTKKTENVKKEKKRVEAFEFHIYYKQGDDLSEYLKHKAFAAHPIDAIQEWIEHTVHKLKNMYMIIDTIKDMKVSFDADTHVILATTSDPKAIKELKEYAANYEIIEHVKE